MAFPLLGGKFTCAPFIPHGRDLKLSVVTEWSKAPGCKEMGRCIDPRWRHFSFEFSLVSRSSQLSEAHKSMVFMQSNRCIG